MQNLCAIFWLHPLICGFELSHASSQLIAVAISIPTSPVFSPTADMEDVMDHRTAHFSHWPRFELFAARPGPVNKSHFPLK